MINRNIAYKYLVFLILIFETSVGAYAQTMISGLVLTEEHEPVVGGVVRIPDVHPGTTTDVNGTFELTGDFSGQLTLEISYLGFSTQRKSVEVSSGQSIVVNIILKEAAIELDQVTVTGKTELRSVKEKAFNVQVVDALQLHHTTLDIGHAL